MGQRFQTYVKLRCKEKNEFNVIGYHLQWSWGQFSLIRAYQLMDFISNDMDYEYSKFKGYYNLDENKEIVKSLLQINQEYKSFVQASEEDEIVCENPSMADNNDGALFIDTTLDKPKYCFFQPYSINPMPISARDYASDYMTYHLEKNDEESKKTIEIYNKYLEKLDKYEMVEDSALVDTFPKMYQITVEE